jgi:hypothetical protein
VTHRPAELGEKEATDMRGAMEQMRGKMKHRREATRLESLDRQNMRLRDEISHLRTRLDDDRTEMDDLKDALKSSPKVVTVKKRTGYFRLAVVGGAAYLLGTRAGRGRYDRFVEWIHSMHSKMERGPDETEETATSDLERTSHG